MRKTININSIDIQDQGTNTAETEYNTISLHSMAKYYEKIIWSHWSSGESCIPSEAHKSHYGCHRGPR